MDILFEKRARVATVTLNRPEHGNAVTSDMRARLANILHEVQDDPDVWVMVLTGAGDVFSGGHDNADHARVREAGRQEAENCYQLLQETWKPTVAAINGLCLAEGTGLALSCDIRIAADTARIGYPQARSGRAALTGPTLLPHLVPLNIAFEMLYTAEPISAERAYQVGLVNAVVPAAELAGATQRMVERILSSGPLAQRVAKEVAVRGRSLPFAERVRLGQRLSRERIQPSADLAEAQAAARENRAPVWQGR